MKKVILILILFSALQTAFAQRDFSSLNQQINDAEYVFEAKSLGYTCYWTTDSQIYTSTILDITKIFKGDLKLGTIEIIGVGGMIDDYGSQSDCSVWFTKNELVIINAIKTNREPIKKNYKLVNGTPLEVNNECDRSVIFINNSIAIETPQGIIETYAHGCYTYFYNEQDLYKSLPKRIDKNADTTVREKNDRPITPEARENFFRTLHKSQGATEAEIDSLLKNPLLERQIYENIKKRKKENDGSDINRKRSHQISYSFRNPTHTGTNNFEFDVFVQGNNDSTYFNHGVVYLNYDTEVFGNDAYMRAVVTQGEAMLQGVYYNPFVNPYSDSTISISLVLPVTLPHNRFHLTTAPIQLCHVKMIAVNCENDVSFSFNEEKMLNISMYQLTPDTSEIGGYPYEDHVIDNNLNMVSCKSPVINTVRASLNGKTININSLTAGIGETIIISGSYFGNIKGEIRLRNVDSTENSTSAFVPVDSVDILTWNDNQIKFRLSSFEGKGFDIFSVGSGKISVKNKSNNQIKLCTTRINIISSVKNYWSKNGSRKIRTFLGNKNSTGNIQFTLNQNITNNAEQQIKTCIDASLSQWRCTSGSWFSINNSSTTISTISQDNSSTIFFSAIVGKTLALAQGFWYEYKGCNDTFALVFEIDIAINSNQNWFYDATCSKPIPSNSTDFYTVCLHELGHAHQIVHVGDSTDLMYPYTQRGRRVNVISLNDKFAVDTIFNLGKKISTNCYTPRYTAMQNGALCPPVLTNFKINNGQDSTNISKITLNNIANNNPISYAVNETGNFTNSVWYAYSTKPTYTLVGLGKHKLYLKVLAANKEVSNILTDSIVLTAKESKTTDNQDNTLLERYSISIYPNPASNIINIVNSNQEEIFTCEIFNTLGTKVKTSILNSNENQIDLSYLPSGIYIVKTKLKKQIFYTKILKKDN